MIIDNLKEIVSTSIDISAAIINLPKFEARAIIITNRFPGSKKDAENSPNFIYWGFNGICPHQLNPGETTPLIPITQLNDVSVQAAPGLALTIWYSYFD